MHDAVDKRFDARFSEHDRGRVDRGELYGLLTGTVAAQGKDVFVLVLIPLLDDREFLHLRRRLRIVVALGFGPWKTLDVECELVACFLCVRLCMVSLCRETSAVEADETDVDAEWSVLIIETLGAFLAMYRLGQYRRVQLSEPCDNVGGHRERVKE
jgi:hypothetical protein